MKVVKEHEQQFDKPSILICGFGIVGKFIKKKFFWADTYDIQQKSDKKNGAYSTPPKKVYDFAFIAVPTPGIQKNGAADLRYVEDCLEKVKADCYIIKSTIPPKTTDKLIKKYRKDIIFSPEYQGNTQHADLDYDFVILGGSRKLTEKVANLFQLVYRGNLVVHQTDAVTAELVKYMENTFLACKVVFCNQFYRIAKKLGVSYTELRELFVADPRVNKSHTFVYENYPFYDSKCFNKDLPAIYEMMKSIDYDASFIKAIIDTNEKFKNDASQFGAK